MTDFKQIFQNYLNKTKTEKEDIVKAVKDDYRFVGKEKLAGSLASFPITSVTTNKIGTTNDLSGTFNIKFVFTIDEIPKEKIILGTSIIPRFVNQLNSFKIVGEPSVEAFIIFNSDLRTKVKYTYNYSIIEEEAFDDGFAEKTFYVDGDTKLSLNLTKDRNCSYTVDSSLAKKIIIKLSANVTKYSCYMSAFMLEDSKFLLINRIPTDISVFSEIDTFFEGNLKTSTEFVWGQLTTENFNSFKIEYNNFLKFIKVKRALFNILSGQSSNITLIKKMISHYLYNTVDYKIDVKQYEINTTLNADGGFMESNNFTDILSYFKKILSLYKVTEESSWEYDEYLYNLFIDKYESFREIIDTIYNEYFNDINIYETGIKGYRNVISSLFDENTTEYLFYFRLKQFVIDSLNTYRIKEFLKIRIYKKGAEKIIYPALVYNKKNDDLLIFGGDGKIIHPINVFSFLNESINHIEDFLFTDVGGKGEQVKLHKIIYDILQINIESISITTTFFPKPDRDIKWQVLEQMLKHKSLAQNEKTALSYFLAIIGLDEKFVIDNLENGIRNKTIVRNNEGGQENITFNIYDNFFIKKREKNKLNPVLVTNYSEFVREIEQTNEKVDYQIEEYEHPALSTVENTVISERVKSRLTFVKNRKKKEEKEEKKENEKGKGKGKNKRKTVRLERKNKQLTEHEKINEKKRMIFLENQKKIFSKKKVKTKIRVNLSKTGEDEKNNEMDVDEQNNFIDITRSEDERKNEIKKKYLEYGKNIGLVFETFIKVLDTDAASSMTSFRDEIAKKFENELYDETDLVTIEQIYDILSNARENWGKAIPANDFFNKLNEITDIKLVIDFDESWKKTAEQYINFAYVVRRGNKKNLKNTKFRESNYHTKILRDIGWIDKFIIVEDIRNLSSAINDPKEIENLKKTLNKTDQIFDFFSKKKKWMEGEYKYSHEIDYEKNEEVYSAYITINDIVNAFANIYKAENGYELIKLEKIKFDINKEKAKGFYTDLEQVFNGDSSKIDDIHSNIVYLDWSYNKLVESIVGLIKNYKSHFGENDNGD